LTQPELLFQIAILIIDIYSNGAGKYYTIKNGVLPGVDIFFNNQRELSLATRDYS